MILLGIVLALFVGFGLGCSFRQHDARSCSMTLGHGRAVAALDLGRRLQFDINDQAITGLLSADGLEASKPQQVLVIQRFMPPNLGWRNLSTARSQSQPRSQP